MTDYEKLTVVKLREELVKRGLPKSGLKAALVERLVEAETQSEQGATSEPAVHQEPNAQISSTKFNGPVGFAQRTTQPSDIPEEPIDNAALASDQQEADQEAQVAPPIEKKVAAPQCNDTSKPSDSFAIPAAASEKPAVEPQAVGGQKTFGEQEDTTPETSAIETQKGAAEATHVEPPVKAQQPVVEQEPQNIPPISTEESTNGSTETRVDTNKRKRRSQSPPPSSVETAQKRTKADDGRPQVVLPEDELNGESVQLESVDASMTDAPNHQQSERITDPIHINGLKQQASDTGKDQTSTDSARHSSTPREANTREAEEPLTEGKRPTSPPPSKVQSPPKISPTDTRFKNLFSAPSKRESSPLRPQPQLKNEDRVISPALHPATSALYIRDIMRPLNPGNLKTYLTALASPTDSDPDPEIITEFFLDSIRTHCLVSFANTSAASRVRLGLHDRVWPDEKNRKSLWVDFVPEEKLKKWIEVETEAAGNRRQGMKKWEVVYEEEDSGVVAYLQEAGPNSSAPRLTQAAAPRTEGGAGLRKAPSGPRGKDTISPGLPSRPDDGKAFGALDDLFSSTTAKPKLYYLAIAREIAEKRLDLLAAGRGGGRGDEMRRFSFEEGTLVDKGPEFGMRGRGGFGGIRGASSRGFPGRGGSHRGDTWRGR